MTNSELIAHAKETMKDMFEASGGKLMEHEKNAYNCLRLFCERIPADHRRCIAVIGNGFEFKLSIMDFYNRLAGEKSYYEENSYTIEVECGANKLSFVNVGHPCHLKQRCFTSYEVLPYDDTSANIATLKAAQDCLPKSTILSPSNLI